MSEPNPETAAELYAKITVGLGAFVLFAVLATFDVTHPAVSVPSMYIIATLAIIGAVFGLDILQRAR